MGKKEKVKMDFRAALHTEQESRRGNNLLILLVKDFYVCVCVCVSVCVCVCVCV